MGYVYPLDPATPADGNYLKEGDDRIREAKAAIRERLATIFTDPDAQPLAFIAQIIGTAAIADAAITLAKMAANSVSTNHLVDGAVTDPKIVSMTGSKLLDNSVVAAKIVDGNITESKLGAGAVSTVKLADLAVIAAKIAAETITAAQIAPDTITESRLAALLRENLVKQSHTDFSVSTFVLGTNSSWDSADLVIGGVTDKDSLIVSVESASSAWAAAMKLVTFYAYVSSNGNVRLRLQNNTGGPATIPTSNWRIMALRRYSDWYP